MKTNKTTKANKAIKVLAAIIIILLLFVFTSPTRAIKAKALMAGCKVSEVITAEFRKDNDNNPNSWGDRYIANSELEDKLTGSGHSTWYVHRILFINIPKWAGNG